MAGAIERLDAQLASFLSDWSITTSFLALVIAALVLYPILFPEEPDTHPLLLARQSSVSPVRNKYESALYRSPEVPHGFPLKTGLNVKDANAPRWATGKDGDLRDVWRQVQRGGTADAEGKEIPKGAILTILGREEIVEQDVTQLSKEINILGRHWKEVGVTRVAIYLPNGVEYLQTIFACSFYGLTAILLPYNLPHPKAYELLADTSADGLICAAGSLPLDDLAQACPKLRLLSWVVEKTSRHMDWHGAPESAVDRLTVSVWHDVVQENQSTADADLPTDGGAPADIVTVWQPKELTSKPDIISYTHANLVAATSALITALPLRQRLSPADLVLPATALHEPYVLCQTLAALYQHASLALTSVAQPGVDLDAATRGMLPTVVIASAETMTVLHTKEIARVKGLLRQFGMYSQAHSLAAGRMPAADGWLFRLLLAPSGKAPGKLRLILTSDRLGQGSPPLTSHMLDDLRIFTRARICYALTAPRVAGAVTQSHVFDYRAERREKKASTTHGPSRYSVEFRRGQAREPRG